MWQYITVPVQASSLHTQNNLLHIQNHILPAKALGCVENVWFTNNACKVTKVQALQIFLNDTKCECASTGIVFQTKIYQNIYYLQVKVHYFASTDNQNTNILLKGNTKKIFCLHRYWSCLENVQFEIMIMHGITSFLHETAYCICQYRLY